MRKPGFLVVLVLALGVWASATPDVAVHETFGSGASFIGTVTFLPDYSNITAVDGWLVGGPYGSDHINWVWDPTTNWAAGFGSQYGGNYLMDGTTCGNECGSYTYFVAVTWNFSRGTSVYFSSPGGVLSSEGGNNVNYNDPMMSGFWGPTPEPSSLLLLGSGLLGVAAIVRRKFLA